MQRFLVILVILFISISPLQAGQNAKPVVKESRTETKEVRAALQPGEQLTYSVKWNDVIAAKVIMSTEQTSDEKRGDAYRLDVKVNTVGMVKDIIQVRDRFSAFIDPKTLLPFRSEREILEGSKNEQGFTIFDQEK